MAKKALIAMRKPDNSIVYNYCLNAENWLLYALNKHFTFEDDIGWLICGGGISEFEFTDNDLVVKRDYQKRPDDEIGDFWSNYKPDDVYVFEDRQWKALLRPHFANCESNAKWYEVPLFRYQYQSADFRYGRELYNDEAFIGYAYIETWDSGVKQHSYESK